MDLTDRQLATLRQLARGLSNDVIATEEHLSVHSVKSRIRTLHDALGATNRVQAVVLGIHRGHITTAEILDETPTLTPRTGTIPTALGCGHCGIDRSRHTREWSDNAGWHDWTPPTGRQQRKRADARETARRAAQRLIAARIAEAGR